MDDAAGAAAQQPAAGGVAAELARLLGVGPVSPWWTRDRAERIRSFGVPVGTTGGGAVVAADVMAAPLGGDGPHALVLGGPGTGKTTTLAAFGAALCIGYPPSAMRVAVLPADPDSELAALGALPHVEVVPAELPAAADWITAESRRRRRELRGVHPARRPVHGPHLLVMVDDYQLLDAGPQGELWREAMWRIVSRGPALNMHLLLATDTLSPAVRMMLPHFGIRIALGTHDLDAPADFQASTPGAALLAIGESEPVACTLADPGGPAGLAALVERIGAAGAH